MSIQVRPITSELPSPLATENLLTTKQAAQRLTISVRTLERWIYEKKIDRVKLGRCVRIKESTLNAFIDANTKPAQGGVY